MTVEQTVSDNSETQGAAKTPEQSSVDLAVRRVIVQIDEQGKRAIFRNSRGIPLDRNFTDEGEPWDQLVRTCDGSSTLRDLVALVAKLNCEIEIRFRDVSSNANGPVA